MCVTASILKKVKYVHSISSEILFTQFLLFQMRRNRRRVFDVESSDPNTSKGDGDSAGEGSGCYASARRSPYESPRRNGRDKRRDTPPTPPPYDLHLNQPCASLSPLPPLLSYPPSNPFSPNFNLLPSSTSTPMSLSRPAPPPPNTIPVAALHPTSPPNTPRGATPSIYEGDLFFSGDQSQDGAWGGQENDQKGSSFGGARVKSRSSGLGSTGTERGAPVAKDVGRGDNNISRRSRTSVIIEAKKKELAPDQEFRRSKRAKTKPDRLGY